MVFARVCLFNGTYVNMKRSLERVTLTTLTFVHIFCILTPPHISVNPIGSPYTTDALPLAYLNLQTSRDRANDVQALETG